MIRSRQRFAFAKRGAAVMLAATLTAGMVPTTALAQTDGSGGATASVAAATNDGFYLEEGRTYTVPVSWLNASTGAESMAASYLSKTATVSYHDGGYDIRISANDKGMGELLGVSYGGIEAAKTGEGQFQIASSTLNGSMPVSLTIKTMQDMGMGPVGVSMSLDTSELPTEPPAVDPDPELTPDPEPTPDPDPDPEPGDQLEVGKTYTVPVAFADASGKPSMAGNMLDPNATVQVGEGSYTVTLVVKAGDAYEFRALTLGADKAPTTLTRDADGNYVFTGAINSLDGTVEVGFTYYVPAMNREMTHSAFATFDTAGATEGSATPEPPATTVDKAKLNEALAAAKKLTQGNKTDEAWDALQAAIASAEKAAANENIPQQGVDGVTAQLNAAIETFKTSADKEAPSGQYGMVVGKTYTASVSYAGTGSFAGMQDMLQQMVTKYFGTAVELSLLEDGTFDVVVYFGGSTGYDDAIGDLTYNGQAVKQSANKTYTVNVPSLESAIDLALHVGGSMNMDITYAMTVDTSTIALKNGDTPVTSVDKTALQSLVDQASALTQGKKSDAAWESLQSTLSAARAVLNDANASQDAVNQAATSLKEAIDRFNASENVSFQVGHTYEVPIAFFKQGSVAEKSMAAQYFGDMALVRPQENGTFTVSFAASGQGLEYIKSLSYQGNAIAQSGNQFTLSIPAAENDTVIPISMSITMMEQLGIGQSQVADMHLYLSQAKDLGTGQTGLVASSSNLAQTGDDTAGLMTLAGGALVAGAAVAMTARRRMTQRK